MDPRPIDFSLENPIISVIAAAVAALAALAAFIQIFLMRRVAHGQLSLEVFAREIEGDLVRDRGIMWALDGIPLDEWTHDQVQAAERVAAHLNQIGFAVRWRFITRRPFMEMWGSRLVRAYRILAPLIEQRRREWNSPNHWIYLEWLARKAWKQLPQRQWWERRAWQRLRRETEGLNVEQVSKAVRPDQDRLLDETALASRAEQHDASAN